MEKLLFTLFLTFIPVMSFFSEGHFIADKSTTTEIVKPVDYYHAEYEKLIKFIKQHEGFVSTPYYCIGGCRTIGHGLRTKYIGKEFRNSITLKQSDSIIRWKIDWGIKKAKKTYPGFNKYQYLVISHLFFCKGVGSIRNHAIHRQLKKGYLNKNSLLFYSNYEKKRKHYRKTRRYEWKLWNFKETWKKEN